MLNQDQISAIIEIDLWAQFYPMQMLIYVEGEGTVQHLAQSYPLQNSGRLILLTGLLLGHNFILYNSRSKMKICLGLCKSRT